MKFILLTCSLLLFLAFTTEGRSNNKFDTEKKDDYENSDDPLGLLSVQPIPGLRVLNRTMRATKNKAAKCRSKKQQCWNEYKSKGGSVWTKCVRRFCGGDSMWITGE